MMQEIKTEKRNRTRKVESPKVDDMMKDEPNDGNNEPAEPNAIKSDTTDLVKKSVLKVQNLSHLSFFEPSSGVLIAEHAVVEIDLHGKDQNQILSNLQQISYLNGGILQFEVSSV